MACFVGNLARTCQPAKNPWSTRVILGVRIIRSLILCVERSRELFHRRAQRQQMNVRGFGLGVESCALTEAKSSSVDACKGCISGALDWACKETVYFERAARDEAPGMSGAWDWVLKEVPRTASPAVWRLGLGVERSTQDSLLRTGEGLWLWAGNS